MSDLRLKRTKFDFRWGSAPDPLAVFSWAGLLLRGGRGKKERRGREGGKEWSACIQLVDQCILALRLRQWLSDKNGIGNSTNLFRFISRDFLSETRPNLK